MYIYVLLLAIVDIDYSNLNAKLIRHKIRNCV